MSTEIQIEDIIDIINENYRLHTGINEGILHAAEDIIELFNSKKIDKTEQSVLPSAKELIEKKIKQRFPLIAQFDNRRYSLDEKDAALWAEEYANLCVEQREKQIEQDFMIAISKSISTEDMGENSYQLLKQTLKEVINHGK